MSILLSSKFGPLQDVMEVGEQIGTDDCRDQYIAALGGSPVGDMAGLPPSMAPIWSLGGGLRGSGHGGKAYWTPSPYLWIVSNRYRTYSLLFQLIPFSRLVKRQTLVLD